MTALAFDHDSTGRSRATSERRLFAVTGASREPVAGTLDALLTGAFTAVGTGTTTSCPVCAGTMQPRWTAGSGANGGRCADCGSTLS